MIKMDYMKLNNELRMPIIGHGMGGPKEPHSEELMKKGLECALKSGHRMIDTVGFNNRYVLLEQVLRQNIVDRRELFLISKVSPIIIGDEQKMDEWVEVTLKTMGTTYFDMLLLHFPLEDKKRNISGYKVLEKYLEKGLTKSIGVSNYDVYDLTKLLDNVTTVPQVNQIEMSFLYTNHHLFRKCVDNNIQVMAYTPTGLGKLQSKEMGTDEAREKVAKLAKRFNITETQVLLGYLLGNGVIPIVKSNSPTHIQENLEIMANQNIHYFLYRSLFAFQSSQRVLGASDAIHFR